VICINYTTKRGKGQGQNGQALIFLLAASVGGEERPKKHKNSLFHFCAAFFIFVLLSVSFLLLHQNNNADSHP